MTSQETKWEQMNQNIKSSERQEEKGWDGWWWWFGEQGWWETSEYSNPRGVEQEEQ